MSSHVAWSDVRAEHVARAGGEDAVEAGKREMLAEVVRHRLSIMDVDTTDRSVEARKETRRQREHGPLLG